MTEGPYETTVPDDLTVGTTSPSAAPGGSTAGSTSQAQGTSDGGGTSVANSVGTEAKSVASDAAESGRQVAGTAASGAKDVVSEASTQLRQLFGQLRGELDDQASSQGQRAAGGLRSLADDLRQMASSSEQQGIAGDLAGQAAGRVNSVADWIENRQPGDMLEELRSLARRKPGAFLLGAAAIGVIGGRMTRSLSGGSGGSTGSTGGGQSSPATGGYHDVGTAGTGLPTAAAVSPAVSPVRSEPYTVGVRDSDTHGVTSMTGGVVDESIGEGFTEGQGGVR